MASSRRAGSLAASSASDGAAALWPDVPVTVATIFSRPSRLLRLAKLGPHGWRRTARFLRTIVPLASDCLIAVRADASQIPDARLRSEALASIDHKAYHVQGGCILGTFLGDDAARRF